VSSMLQNAFTRRVNASKIGIRNQEWLPIAV
jgi:hypothetical protein